VSDKFKWLWRFYRYYPKVIAILLILTPIQVAIAVTVPRMVGFTIDYLKQDQVPEHWLAQLAVSLGGYLNLSPGQSFGLAFVLMGLVAVILYAYFQSWRAWMNVRLEWHFRQDAFDRITEKGPDFFNRFRTGDMVTRLTDDVAEKLSWFACSGIFRFYEATLSVIFIILMMISIDPTITMWTAGPLPLLILIFFKTSSLLDRRYEALQRSISVVNDAMEACFSGIRVVKAYVREAAQQAVLATRQGLVQVEQNVLLNAVQAVPNGGHVAVAIRMRSDKTVQLEVRDDGPGVAKENCEEVFRPYYTTSEKGTGLGLAVVRQIAHAHHWKVNCEPGDQGAVFRVGGIRLAQPQPRENTNG